MSLPYFPMYPSDFEAKTSHLTLAEDGAYNRLLRIMWMTSGCTIPNDAAWIMRRLRCDQDTFDSVVKVVIDEFFTSKNGRLSNAKLSDIFAATNEAHKKRVSAGSKGGKAKSLKTLADASSNAKAMPKQPEPEPEPIIKDTSVSQKATLFDPPDKPKPAKRKSKPLVEMPDGWIPNDKNIEHALSKNFSSEEIENEADKFRNNHQSKGSKFKDWDAAWRTWIGYAVERRQTRGVPYQASYGGEQQAGGLVGAAMRRRLAGE